MKNLAHLLAVPLSELVVNFISLAAVTLSSWTTGLFINSLIYVLVYFDILMFLILDIPNKLWYFVIHGC